MEMNCVSQKAHFIIAESVITASLQAQLKANMAPGLLVDGPLLLPPPLDEPALPAVPLVAAAPPFEEAPIEPGRELGL